MKQLTILAVDDDPLTLKMLEKKLTKEGYDIETASNGVEAEKLISQTFYDIIITDLVMPGGVDGMDVLDAAKTKNRQTEVILLTAHASVENAVEAMRKGAADYLQKPINFYELTLRMEKIRNYKKLLKNAQDLREAMDVTEQNAAQTIQYLEMSVAELQSIVSEIRQVIMSQRIDPGKCVDRVFDIVSSC
ncbi:MAG: response regulator [Deltaproteobacteria bacterium]|jgi:DNA-binding NtrC family response regulator|nr:response regulator [Deltaproteobacteria bacterium]